MNTEEFKRLLEKLKQGDKRALEQLYTEYFGKIYTYALCKARNRDLAYDAAMNVIMKLIYYPGDIDAIRNPVGLMMTMTKNVINDDFRHSSFCTPVDQTDLYRGTGPFESLWLEDILQVLTEEERNLFLEHTIWERPLRDIAKQQNKPYITIRRMYHRVKEKIKSVYRE